MMKNRIYYLDALKGILIILVVLGHVIQFTNPNYQHDFLFRFIYSFHMPLFFAISGYLMYKGKFEIQLFRKSIFQLLLPFITWAFLLPIAYDGNIDWKYTFRILLYPDNGLWFLYNLFIYRVLFAFSEKWSIHLYRQEIFILLIFFVLSALMLLLHTLLNMTQLCWFFPFFAIGFYVHKYEAYLGQYMKWLMWCFGIVYVVTVPFWMMREPPLFYKWLDLGILFSYLYRYGVEIAGTCFFLLLGKRILNQPINWLNELGRRTLGIYAFQFIVIHYMIMLDNVFRNVFLLTIMTVLLSFCCTEIIRRIRYVRLFMIGEK